MTSLCLSLLAKFSLCHSKVISLQLKNINFLKRKNSLFGFDFWHLIFIWICLSYPAWSLLSFVSFIRFEFSPIISSDSLPAPFSLFSPSKTPIVCMFTCWMIFLRFHSLCPLQFFSFVFLWSIIDIVLSSHWLHCWNVSLNPSGDVSFQLLYFSALKEKGFGFLLDYLSYLLISAFVDT